MARQKADLGSIAACTSIHAWIRSITRTLYRALRFSLPAATTLSSSISTTATTLEVPSSSRNGIGASIVSRRSRSASRGRRAESHRRLCGTLRDSTPLEAQRRQDVTVAAIDYPY